MKIRTVLAAATGVACLAAGLAFTSPASAATTPATGECYNMTVKQAGAAAFPYTLVAVPCTAVHTFEVTEAGVVPADANAKTWSADKCSWTNINKQLGINKNVGGIIRNPLRISTYFFYGPAGDYQCGVAVERLLGKSPATFEKLTKPVADLIADDQGFLAICYSSKGGRVPNVNPVTISCKSSRGWYKFAVVNLGSLGSKFPGGDAIAKRLNDKCQGFDYGTWPSKKQWSKTGDNYGACFVKMTPAR